MQRVVLFIFMVAALTIAFATWSSHMDSRRAEAVAAFERNVDLIHAALKGRLSVYTALVRSAVGFWQHDRQASASEWALYVDSLDIDANHAGINGLTFTAYVKAADRATFLSHMEDPSFAIRPTGDRRDYYVITHIEPHGRGHKALGFDVGSEPRRREAAERARDSGAIAMTDALSLGMGAGLERDFVLFAPVYSGLPPFETEERRRAALRGWVSMGIHGETMLADTLADVTGLGMHVIVSHLGAEGQVELYSHPRGEKPGADWIELRRVVAFGGQTWELCVHGHAVSVGLKDAMLLVLGLGLALALTWVMLLLLVSRAQAQTIANNALSSLGRAERRLGFIVAATPSVIYSCSIGDGYQPTYVSDGIRAFGYDPAAVVGDSEWWRGGIHPEDLARITPLMDEIIEMGVGEFVYRFRTAGGDWRWLLDRMTVVTDDDGRPVEMVGSLTDVTARREAEAALARNELKYRSIVRATAEGYWLIDPVSRETLEVNDSLCAMLGYQAEEMIGRLPTDFVDAENRRVFERQMKSIGEHDHRMYEIALRRKDGREIITHFSATTLRDEAGQPSAAFAFVTDITAERMHEREIARLQERLAQILAMAGEGICGFDSMGHVIFANDALQTLCGWPEDELIGYGSDRLFAFAQENGQSPIIRARHGATIRTAATLLRRDGGGLPIELVATPLRDANRTVGTVVVLRDVTERNRFEAELESKSRDLARSNAELEAFAYVASHDLRQPLRMVTSFLTLLERRLAGKLEADCSEYLTFARDGARRMDELILALLEYSRVGRDGRDHQPVPLSQVAEAALVNLRPAIEETGTVVTVAPGLPTISGDHIELVRLLQNLIGNAIKYRSPDRQPEISVSGTESNGEFILAVADNGIGIEPEYHDRVFRIFQRLHTQQEVEGTGIGLALCRKIVEHHYGRIWVDSTPGEGSTFYVALPLTLGDRSGEPAALTEA